MPTPNVTEADLANLRHMVGAATNTPKKQWGYRNHYASGSKDNPSMERLVAVGYAIMGKPYQNGFYYHATEKGCKAIGLSKAAIKRALDDNY